MRRNLSEKNLSGAQAALRLSDESVRCKAKLLCSGRFLPVARIMPQKK